MKYFQDIKKLVPFFPLDIKMPKMGGIEAITEIKKIDNKANIIIMTAFSENNDVRELAKDNSIKIIDKPFEIAEIKKCL